jgi:hypothetical protein
MAMSAWGKLSRVEVMAGRLITASPTQLAERIKTFFISGNMILPVFPIVATME